MRAVLARNFWNTEEMQKRRPLVSVCIPVFNGEKYIRECVSSVLSQSQSDFEIVVVDNCSTDATVDVCREFKDSRIRIVQNERNIGSIGNFNECIRQATGECFMLLPADDLLVEGCLETLSTAVQANPSVGIAFGSSISIDDFGRRLRSNQPVCQVGVLSSSEMLSLIAGQFNPIQHPMVRTSVFSRAGGFDKKYGCFCDIHLWSKVLFSGWHAYYMDQETTSIRSYQGQGQTLFSQNTKANLERLSSHYGRSLGPAFLRKNNYNLLFYWFIRFLQRNSGRALGKELVNGNCIMAKLARSQLGNLQRSVIRLNRQSCAAEISLLLRMRKAYGSIALGKNFIAAFVGSLQAPPKAKNGDAR